MLRQKCNGGKARVCLSGGRKSVGLSKGQSLNVCGQEWFCSLSALFWNSNTASQNRKPSHLKNIQVCTGEQLNTFLKVNYTIAGFFVASSFILGFGWFPLSPSSHHPVFYPCLNQSTSVSSTFISHVLYYTFLFHFLLFCLFVYVYIWSVCMHMLTCISACVCAGLWVLVCMYLGRP